jgi:autotransporter translocation and assembly factor TamB
MIRVLPMLALLFWGSVYLWRCVQVILPPDGLDIAIPTENGVVQVRTKLVSLNIWSRELVARDAMICAPGGDIIAQVGRVGIKGPSQGYPSYSITLDDVKGSLERMPNGSWRYFDLLPKKTTSAGNTAFRVDVRSANVQVIDRTSSKPSTIRLFVKTAQVTGVGDRWLARGKVAVEELGNVAGLLRVSPEGGVGFNFDADKLNLASLINHFKNSREGRNEPELKRLSVHALWLTGKVRGHYSKNNKLSFTSISNVQFNGLAYGDISFDEGSFTGQFTQQSATGRLVASSHGVKAETNGTATWGQGTQISGSLHVVTAKSSQIPLWMHKRMPKNLVIEQGQFDGMLSYLGAKTYNVDGQVRAQSATWSGEQLHSTSGNLHLSSDRFAIHQLSAFWMKSPLHGDFNMSLSSQKIDGFAGIQNLSLSTVSNRFKGPSVKGFANAQVVISGDAGHPIVDLRAEGTASANIYASQRIYLGAVEFAGHYSEGRLRIQRLAAAGPNGVFVANGIYNYKKDNLNIIAVGNGVDLASFNDQIQGTGIFQIHLKGKPSAPVASGRTEIIGAEIMNQSIPFAAGTIRWDRNGLFVRDLLLTKGATRASGYLSWNAYDQQLDGELRVQDVLLSDWIKSNASGSINIGGATISGTLSQPIARIHGTGNSLVLGGVRIDQAGFSIVAMLDKVILRSLRLQTGEGKATASGYLDFTPARGEIQGEAKGIPVGRLLALLPESFVVDGSVDGHFHASFNGAELTELSSEGNADKISLNGVFLGSGPWSIKKDGPEWAGYVMVGQIERFIEIPNLRYNPQTRSLNGSITAFQLSANNLFTAFKRYLPSESSELSTRLDNLEGDISLNASFDGSVDDPTVDITVAQANHLNLGGQDLGDIELKAKRADHKWHLANLSWTCADGFGKIAGEVDERGTIDLDGDLQRIPHRLLSVILPNSKPISGYSDLAFHVVGRSSSPEITASWKATNIGVQDSTVAQSDRVVFDLNLVSMKIEEGSISAKGQFFYKGIYGDVAALIPFRYPLEISRTAPFNVMLSLSHRSIEEFAEFAPWIDAKKTAGFIDGQLAMTGSINNPEVKGNLSIDCPQWTMQNLDTALKDLKVNVLWEGRQVDVSVKAKSSKGGDFAASGSIANLDPLQVVDDFQQVLSSRISGTIVTNSLHLSQNSGKKGSAALTANGKAELTGTLRSPLIAGKFDITDANGVAPTLVTASEEKEAPTINPRFDLSFDVAPGAKAKASNAEVVMLGSGTLSGTLYRPKVQSNFTVMKGTLKLPNARINLEEGGLMRFSYEIDRDGIPDPRLDVNLAGQTTITALRFGTTLERYSISLQIQGNLMKEGNMKVIAQSDPPDLSQDRIMAILGQGDLFEGLAQWNQSTLTSYAVPVVFDAIGQKIAMGLGLEYLSIEYDLFQRTTITAARTLGGGFTLMGSRQITPSTFGRDLFEIRLTYRLPFKNETLRSFMIGAGADQDRPWKFSIEFGRRF